MCRALIKTHHMTSRKKIMAISKAAKQYNCAVYLKTGSHTPGVMIGECDGEDGEESLKEWVRSVKVGILLFLMPQVARNSAERHIHPKLNQKGFTLFGRLLMLRILPD